MCDLLKKKVHLECSIDELRYAADYLGTKPVVECDPYPNYRGEIFTVLDSLGTDTNYLSKYEKLRDKDIDAMTADDLRVMYTFMLRGERFSDGTIAEYVEDGTLFRLAVRELELFGGGEHRV